MELTVYYHEFKTAIFLSSLTIGTFLFTMKTFIIQTIKKEIYDHKTHKALVKSYAEENGDDPVYYKGIKDLSKLIFWSIVMALLSALTQITIGYFKYTWAAVICLLIAVVSWAMLTRVLIIVSQNMQDMIDFSETDAQENTKD